MTSSFCCFLLFLKESYFKRTVTHMKLLFIFGRDSLYLSVLAVELLSNISRYARILFLKERKIIVFLKLDYYTMLLDARLEY